MKQTRQIMFWVLGIAFVIAGCNPATPNLRSTPHATATASRAPAPMTDTSTQIPTPTTTPLADVIPDTTILYARDCGLYAFPPVAALDKPEMREVYSSVSDCAHDVGRYLIGNAPTSSPDGKQLLITSPYETWLANLETGALRKLFSESVAATWSPQGDQIAYVSGETLYQLALNTESKPVALFQHPGLIPVFARWSPNGKWVAIASLGVADKNGQQPITFWMIPAAGGDAQELGTFPAPGIELVPEDIRWSPNSDAIATFMGWVLSLDGRQQHVDDLGSVDWWLPARARRFIGNQVDPKWDFSHDGKRLAFAKPLADRIDIAIIETTTQQQTVIGSIQSSLPRVIRWSPDDKFLIIGTGEGIIWAMPVMIGSTAEMLLKDAVLVDVIPRPKSAP